MKEGYDGRLYERQGRWKFLSVYGKRCRYCHRGILWIKKEDTRRQMAIEPCSWDGEEWFISRKHRVHSRYCVGMRDQMQKKYRKKVDPGLIL